MKAIPHSTEQYELEISAIFADATFKKGGKRKLGIFRTEPEEIEFITKLYLPFYGRPSNNNTTVLCPFFFEREIEDFRIPKQEIDGIIHECEEKGIRPTHLSKIKEYLKKSSRYKEKLRGVYPNNFPRTFSDEFSFIKNSNFQDIDEEDGIIVPSLSEDEIDHLFTEIDGLLSKMFSDIEYLSGILRKVSGIVYDQIGRLNTEKKRIDDYYKPIYERAKANAMVNIRRIEHEILEKISRLEDNFRHEISSLSGYYPPLYSAVIKPYSSGGKMGLLDIFGEAADTFARLKSFMSYEREPAFEEAARVLRSKIRSVRAVANSIEGDDRETKKFRDTVNSVCKHVERELNNILNSGAYEIRKELATVSSVKSEWSDKVNSIEDEINKLRKGLGEVEKLAKKMIEEKNKKINDILKNVTVEGVEIDGWFYLTFYIVSLTKKDRRRFLVYPLSFKKDKRGFSLRGYVHPFECFSEGISKLGEIIEKKLNEDEKMQMKVVMDGKKFDLLKDARDLIKSGLKRLLEEGWIKEKKYKEVITAIDK